MNADRAAKWAVTRRQGRNSYVWRSGVLQFGLVIGGAMAGAQIGLNPSRWLFLIALYLPIWLGAGFLAGLSTWYTTERSYARYLAKNQPPEGGSGAP